MGLATARIVNCFNPVPRQRLLGSDGRRQLLAAHLQLSCQFVLAGVSAEWAERVRWKGQKEAGNDCPYSQDRSPKRPLFQLQPQPRLQLMCVIQKDKSREKGALSLS